jgi:glycine cleavage system H protein
MPDELTFMMGKFAARLPADRRYAKNHMWAKADGAGWVVGFSAYAVRLLQDVYFLDWHVEAGMPLTERQEIGEIESSKAESALYSPLAGQLREINAAVLKDPSAINVDTYGEGWLLAIDGPGDELLSIEDYVKHLESAWKVAERTIKGQFNE